MRKNDAFVAKIVITRLTKGFMAMFAKMNTDSCFRPHADRLDRHRRPCAGCLAPLGRGLVCVSDQIFSVSVS